VEIFDSILEEMEPQGICSKCLGGGRILNEEDKKKIKIYGTSRVSKRDVFAVTVGLKECILRHSAVLITKGRGIYYKRGPPTRTSKSALRIKVSHI